MKKTLTAIVALASIVTAMPASAQHEDRDRDHGRWEHRDRDRDRDHDRWEHRDHDRGDRGDRGYRHDRWHYYGGSYGYNGYGGRWRTGMRYPYWNDRSYYVTNYYDYGLPPPRRGYRYYRDPNGDIVLVAITSGIIGMILGGAIASDHHHGW